MPAKLSTADIRYHIANDLTLEQAKDLQNWLADHLAALERQAEEWLPPTANQVMATRRLGKSCLLLEGVKCGKENCRCASGKLHGPYWYEYWREGSRVRKRYHGKQIRS
ncbi:MAG: hypothetical protein ICV62_08140 [Cyanobacteria bacterium Co-bin13]|nr:hypothetical protein [Cyanobacteria bacterium Co-bin13]